ncbi:MAG: hypothetical protein V2B19_28575 [Pseudomonadota bacterium]
MKLHFEPNLEFQLASIEALCDLYREQEICRTEFTVTRDTLKNKLTDTQKSVFASGAEPAFNQTRGLPENRQQISSS